MPIKKTKKKARKQKILLVCIMKDDSEYKMASHMLDMFMPYMAGLAVALTGTSGKHNKLKKLILKHGGRYVVTKPNTHPKIYTKRAKGGYYFSNFAEARNVSFELASKMQKTGNYDWWSWADTDDILIGGDELQFVASEAQRQKLDSVYFNYWYSVVQNKQGEITDIAIEHLRERLIKPDEFKWISRLHEVSVPKEDGYQPRNSVYDVDPEAGQKCVWAHLPGEERIHSNIARNREILELQYKEQEGKDPRTIFYLGRTYMDHSRIVAGGKDKYLEMAIKMFDDYLHGEYPSGWEEERANAWEYLGNAQCEKDDLDGAIKSYHAGIAEFPGSHMLFLMLSKAYFDKGLVEKAKYWLDIVTRMDAPKSRTTIGNPAEIKTTAATIKYNIAISEQNVKEALHWMQVRNKLMNVEGDEMEKMLVELNERNDAAMWVFNYAKWLKKTGNIKQVRKLLDAIAPEMQGERFVSHIASEVLPPKTWDKGSIVYFAGPGFEQWSPKSLKKGLGGSETAIVELSKRWAKMGKQVTVYCDCGAEEGVYEGVTYVNWQKINWKDKFYTFIIWRNPQLIDQNISAYNLFYDAHDVENQTNWTDERIEKIHKVFFKSQWHRENVPKLPDAKCQVITNGINI